MEFRRYDRTLRHLLSVPFIYGMFLPTLVFHAFLELYHAVCFPLYGLEYVPQDRYIRIDRHELEYLTIMEKINCAYCGYTIGVIAYASAIGAATEEYWCGIKHNPGGKYVPPSHHECFLQYGNAREFHRRYG